MPWKIVRVERVDTSPDRDTGEASLVHLEQRSAIRRVTVELGGTAALSGKRLDARDAISGFLSADAPPLRLVVTAEGVKPAAFERADVRSLQRGLKRMRRPRVGALHDPRSHTLFRLAPWV